MKIKTKKQLNLPQLIEWAWENLDKVQSEIFISNVSDVFGNYSTVHFSVDGYGFRTDGVANNDTFTVEVEEEITEDTVVSEMLTVYKDGVTNLTNNKSLNDLSGYNLKSVYVMNDDLRLILIWRDGKLVD